jgi:anti-sigma regulatory factor (Ser/Thr protein kinase)
LADSQPFRQRFEVRVGDPAEAGRGTSLIRTLLKEVGFHPNVVRRTGIATYEAEMNMVLHSEEGYLELILTPEEAVVVAEDKGPGIPDIPLAMSEGYSTASEAMREMGFGAGMGLPNIKRNCDKLVISSQVGCGVRLEMLFEPHQGSVGKGVVTDRYGRPLESGAGRCRKAAAP